MHRIRGSFRAKQIGCTNLNAGRAQCHRGLNPVRIRNPPGSNHGKAYGLDNLRNQRQRPDLRADIFRQEHPAMPTSFEPLCNDGINSLGFKPQRFFKSRG
jgi:hypothetical protein